MKIKIEIVWNYVCTWSLCIVFMLYAHYESNVKSSIHKM